MKMSNGRTLMTLDEIGEGLLRAASHLKKQEEYRRAMSFERFMALLQVPVGELPGGLLYGGKVN